MGPCNGRSDSSWELEEVSGSQSPWSVRITWGVCSVHGFSVCPLNVHIEQSVKPGLETFEAGNSLSP